MKVHIYNNIFTYSTQEIVIFFIYINFYYIFNILFTIIVRILLFISPRAMNNMLNIEVYLTKNYKNNCFIRKYMDIFVMSYLHQ